MKILFLSTTFPDASSPSRGTYNAALCSALAKRHEVRVVSPRMFTEAYSLRGRKTYSTPQSLQQLGITSDYPTYWYTPKLWQHCYGGQMWWSVRKSVEKAISEFSPDAVLSYWAHPDGEAGVRAAQLAGIPSGVIVGGTDVLILPQIPRRGERVRDVLLQSDVVLTVSKGLEEAVTKLQINPDRVQTVYQGIDPTIFHTNRSRSECQKQLNLDPEVAHLVWVGRIVPIKALEVLISAVEKLKGTGTRFVLHLLGAGPSRPQLEQEVSRRQLNDVIRFEGAVAPQLLADWYRAAHLVVLSSDSEGLPNVLRESLACGTAFVSTDVGSIREIADARFSRLVPRRDAVAMCSAIQEMLDPQFAMRAASYVPRQWDDCAREIEERFEQLIAARRHSTASHHSNDRDSSISSPLNEIKIPSVPTVTPTVSQPGSHH